MSGTHTQVGEDVKVENMKVENMTVENLKVENKGETPRVENDWTIMVFFAGEQDLSPSMTSQLKAIKDAGFQKNTTVLIHYDPNKRGVGTFTFDINREGKKKMGTSIGDGRDSFVRNLFDDVIKGAPKGATAAEAVRMFLQMAGEKYPAKHYIIILVGHGVIVGNDAFLPDTSPETTAITLKELGEILSGFRACANFHGRTVELIGLHSCSMSAVEVVYELKGAAKYLLATEGLSFVGSWPYRQVLKKILNTIDEAKTSGGKVNVERLMMSIQRLCLHNSKDFMFSGISADLCLCSLRPEKVNDLNEPLKNLTHALKEGLKYPRSRELITLAHLKAQSYFEEMYTDLYDFCLCLEKTCIEGGPVQEAMKKSCKGMKDVLKETNDPNGFIVRSDFFGPLYQYSHGLSIYFPWASPVVDNPPLPADDILRKYADYAFTKEFEEDDSWLSFLKAYFKATLRDSRAVEDESRFGENGRKESETEALAAIGPEVISLDSLEKSSPSTGKGTCSCVIKNYPILPIRSGRAAQDPNDGKNGSPSRQLAEVVAHR